jgi:malate synthase
MDSLSAVQVPAGVEILGSMQPGFAEVLSVPALEFVASLARAFELTRRQLLSERVTRQAAIDAGRRPDFPTETASVREAAWFVAPPPPDLQRRHIEITGPVDRKMIINALNSGADVYMADLEDSHAPVWEATIQGQLNVREAIEGTIEFKSPDGRLYRLGPKRAVLLVRPRGWHLRETHVRVDGQPVSASLFDFGLFLFHNAQSLVRKGTGPYFYLPKMEGHREARLWNDVFVFSQERLGLPRGTIRATVLIENILAAFEMDEILYELRDHIAGLNAGRWDYLFSIIRKFRRDPELVLPDRAQLTMTVPFMRAYTELLVKTCHRRGAHAMGGMAAFIPSRRDPKVNEIALARVREDKERETTDGFDGTWVAHPDLVPVAREAFDRKLGARPHQKDRLREEVAVTARELLDFRVPGGSITEAGVRNNISVALQYLEAWLGGTGCVPIFNLMEDAATAEISRSQLWQWLHRPQARLADGRAVTPELYHALEKEELDKIRGLVGDERFEGGHFAKAREILEELVLGAEYTEFLTVRAYPALG